MTGITSKTATIGIVAVLIGIGAFMIAKRKKKKSEMFDAPVSVRKLLRKFLIDRLDDYIMDAIQYRTEDNSASGSLYYRELKPYILAYYTIDESNVREGSLIVFKMEFATERAYPHSIYPKLVRVDHSVLGIEGVVVGSPGWKVIEERVEKELEGEKDWDDDDE